jgi:hypothetical protein
VPSFPAPLNRLPRAVRLAVLWLLVWALPLQGAAAASLWHCAKFGSSAFAASVMNASIEAAAEQRGADHSGHRSAHHSAGHHGAGHAQADLGLDASGDDASPDSVVKKHSCLACALCCIGSAVPCAAWAFEGSSPAEAPDERAGAGHRPPALAGLERPPRG